MTLEDLGHSVPEVVQASARRRAFAIISHPDAGKTTVTEKFLLYSGSIDQAGAVKARRDRRSATSDWMEMEKERGISITSTALRFEHRGAVMNLLDTPGHRDFSEDTYRVLSAVDCALMVIDAAKGIEAQTLKLFEVCRSRGTPLLTFINKMDRPSLDPLGLLDDIRGQIGVEPTPVTWPVGDPGSFRGVIDRRDRTFHKFTRTARGATIGHEEVVNLEEAPDPDDATVRNALDEEALLDASGLVLDRESFLGGETTPVFFGSALSNFGIKLLLDALVDLAPSPAARSDRDGPLRELSDPFSGFVFKVQANMDPRHRDRVAFVRVCSGRFERGAIVTHVQSGRPYALNYAHQLFGQERETVDFAYPGDIVGLVNAGDLHIGDTLYLGEPVEFPKLPTFAPEHFMVVRNVDASRYKQFRRSLIQLEEEGVVQVLRHPDRGDREPLLAAVGPMQFEVTQHRLENEFKIPVKLTATEYKLARMTDREGEAALGGSWEADVFHRADGQRFALFKSTYQLERLERERPEIMLERIVV
ncbi:MAG: peptide chain release factor 3 [Actinomycetota bacterium]